MDALTLIVPSVATGILILVTFYAWFETNHPAYFVPGLFELMAGIAMLAMVAVYPNPDGIRIFLYAMVAFLSASFMSLIQAYRISRSYNRT
jgi:hypothetical protein